MAVFLFRLTLPFSRFVRRCRPFWHATAFPQSPYIRRLRQPEDWSPMVQIEPPCFANPLPTSTVFCAARNRAICHFSSQRRTDLSSTSKPPMPSALLCPMSNDREDAAPRLHHAAWRSGGRLAARGARAAADAGCARADWIAHGFAPHICHVERSPRGYARARLPGGAKPVDRCSLATRKHRGN